MRDGMLAARCAASCAVGRVASIQEEAPEVPLNSFLGDDRDRGIDLASRKRTAADDKPSKKSKKKKKKKKKKKDDSSSSSSSSSSDSDSSSSSS